MSPVAELVARERTMLSVLPILARDADADEFVASGVDIPVVVLNTVDLPVETDGRRSAVL